MNKKIAALNIAILTTTPLCGSSKPKESPKKIVSTAPTKTKKSKSKKGKTMIGTKAPAFSLKDQDGKTHSLAKYKGKKVALYFYPRDMTSNCTKQACSIRDGYSKLKDENIQILGISTDSKNKHQTFSDKHNLKFPLLSDDGGTIAKQYNSLKNILGIKFAKRHTFLIDENGIVIKVIKNPDVSDHANQIIKEFKK